MQYKEIALILADATIEEIADMPNQIGTYAVFSTIIGFLPIILLGIVLYFVPTFIAYKKQHLQKKAILILNIFLGWSFIGWVVALIWSVLKNEKNS